MKIQTVKIFAYTILVLLCCLNISSSFALTPTEVAKLLASDGAAGDGLGRSVSLDGDTAVIGAVDEDNNGAAYVFVRNAGVWTEQAKLLASDNMEGDAFGLSVSVSGDTALIGAFDGDDDNGIETGAVYEFVRNAGVWTEQAKLLASDGEGGDNFGLSVSVDGNTAVIGANGDQDNGFFSGSAYVFVRNAGVWTEQAKLLASDGVEGDSFSESVSVSGNTAVISSVGEAAYVFVRNAGVWTEQTKLLASDGATDDGFGSPVSVSGDTAVIGADGDNDNGEESGSAYVFVRNAGVWTEQAKLLASDGAAADKFGNSVSVDGEIVVIGAFVDDDNGEGSGSAYVFVRNAGVWTEQAKLLASDGAAFDLFGGSVSVDGDTAVIGVRGDDDNGNSSGSAYVFDGSISVDIDIKPGDDSNTINLLFETDVWVAILSDTDSDTPFDPLSQVDIPTVEFGPNKANAIGQDVDDINNDGLDDLLLLFNIAESGLTFGTTQAFLTGTTFAGLLFIGSDGVTVFISDSPSGAGSFYLLPLLLIVLIAIKKFR